MTDTRPDFSKMTGEEGQAFVQQRWPDCFMHIHGPECCIISHNWKKVDELKTADPSFNYICGPDVIIPVKWMREQQKVREDYLWRFTAAWLYEKEISAKLRIVGTN